MMAHGFQRLYYSTVNDFGEFLNAKGFPIGPVLAWSITLFELIGGLMLMLGKFTRWICFAWMIVIVMGIILVHAQNGWFVVGPSTGGVEYSIALLLMLITLASHDAKN
jgi:putative oxidoreductase